MVFFKFVQIRDVKIAVVKSNMTTNFRRECHAWWKLRLESYSIAHPELRREGHQLQILAVFVH